MTDSNYKVLTKTLNIAQHLFLNVNKKPNKTNNQYIYTNQENSSTVNYNPNPSAKEQLLLQT